MVLMNFIALCFFPVDSVGLRFIENKAFIVYKVSEGESFFSISRRYGLKPYQLRAANPEVETLKIGETILVPTASPAATSKPNIYSGQTKIHQVELGETLFSLSQLYGVSIRQIRQLNELLDHKLKEGQKLKIGTVRLGPQNIFTLDSIALNHTVQGGETAISICSKYKIPLDLLFKNNNLPQNAPLQTGMELIIAPRLVTVLQAEAEFSYYSPDPLGMPTNFDERGTGALIYNDIAKNIALHSPETMGRYIKVFFPGTKRAVMVKVVGEIAQHERKKGIIVKISKHAGKSLGIKNQEFPVILQYEKP
jgi:LysM repeat protein